MKVILSDNFKKYLKTKGEYDNFIKNVQLTRFDDYANEHGRQFNRIGIETIVINDNNLDDAFVVNSKWRNLYVGYQVLNIKFDLSFEPSIETFLVREGVFDEYVEELKKYLLRNSRQRRYLVTSLSSFDTSVTNRDSEYWRIIFRKYEIERTEFHISVTPKLKKFLKQEGVFEPYMYNVKDYVIRNGYNRTRSVKQMTDGFQYGRSIEGKALWTRIEQKYIASNVENMVTFSRPQFVEFLKKENIFEKWLSYTVQRLLSANVNFPFTYSDDVLGFHIFGLDTTEEGISFWKRYIAKYKYEFKINVLHTKLNPYLESFLLKEGVYDEFMQEVYYYNEVNGNRDFTINSVDSYIDWDETESGVEYWHTYQNKFEDYVSSDNG